MKQTVETTPDELAQRLAAAQRELAELTAGPAWRQRFALGFQMWLSTVMGLALGWVVTLNQPELQLVGLLAGAGFGTAIAVRAEVMKLRESQERTLRISRLEDEIARLAQWLEALEARRGGGSPGQT